MASEIQSAKELLSFLGGKERSASIVDAASVTTCCDDVCSLHLLAE